MISRVKPQPSFMSKRRKADPKLSLNSFLLLLICLLCFAFGALFSRHGSRFRVQFVTRLSNSAISRQKLDSEGADGQRRSQLSCNSTLDTMILYCMAMPSVYGRVVSTLRGTLVEIHGFVCCHQLHVTRHKEVSSHSRPPVSFVSLESLRHAAVLL